MSKKYSIKKKFELIIAIIGLMGVIITALFTNWDKLFPPKIIKGHEINKYKIIYSGCVKDKASKLPIIDAEISFLCHFDINPKRTDSNGLFYFEIVHAEKQLGMKVVIVHDDYKEWSYFRILTINSTPEEIFLESKNGEKKNEIKKRPKQFVDIDQEFEISGCVVDLEGNGISGVEISIDEKFKKTFSTSNGSFSLKVKEKKGNRILIRIHKKGYKPRNDYIFLPNESVIIPLEK